MPTDANSDPELVEGNDEAWIDLDSIHAHDGTPSHPGGQVAIIEAAMSNFCVTVMNGRSSGKTMGLFILLSEEGRQTKGRYEYAYVAPAHSTAEKFFRVVRHAYEDMVVAQSNKGQDRWLELAPFGDNEGAILNFWSGEPGSLDNVRGPRLNRLVFDEAPNIHRSALAACTPMMTGRDGKMVAVGTARRGGCGNKWFGDLIVRARNGEPGYVTFNMPTESSPYNRPEDVARDRRLFRDPNALDVVTPEEREEFDGEIISDVGAYFRNLDRCFTLPAKKIGDGHWIGVDERGEEVRPVPGRKYCLGQDYGKKVNHSVSCVIDRETHDQVEVRRERLGASYDGQMQRIDALKAKWNDALLIADAREAGVYINERLRVKYGDRMREVALTASGENNKGAHCARMRDLFDMEGWRFLNVKEQRDEFEEFAQIPIGESGNGFHYMAPSGRQDDFVLAALFASTVIHFAVPVVRPPKREAEAFSPAWFAGRAKERRRVSIRRGIF